MEDTAQPTETSKDTVCLLQEFCMKFRLGHALYHLTAENTIEDGKIYEMQVSVRSLGLTALGAAKVKKKAKHIAAEQLISQIFDAAESGASLHEYTKENVHQFYEYLKPFRIDKEDPNATDLTDCPFLLKDWCFNNNFPQPDYILKSADGPAHNRTYSMVCQVLHHETTGEGKTKKLAKRLAADQMLLLLTKSMEMNQRPL